MTREERVSRGWVELESPCPEGGAREIVVAQRHGEWSSECPKCGDNKDILTMGLASSYGEWDTAESEMFCWCRCGHTWIWSAKKMRRRDLSSAIAYGTLELGHNAGEIAKALGIEVDTVRAVRSELSCSNCKRTFEALRGDLV